MTMKPPKAGTFLLAPALTALRPVILSPIALSMLAPGAHAAGLALRDGDATSTANAYVGGVSRAGDAATVSLNPAGLSLLPSSEFYGNVFYIDPTARFSGRNRGADGRPTPGSTGGGNIDPSGSGGSFGAWKVTDRLAIGLGVTVPYGVRMNYPTDWVGRYQSLVTHVSDYDLTLAASYRLTPKLSIGLGPRMDFLTGRFTRALNLASVNLASVNLASGPIPGNSVADISGNGFAFGYVAGMLYMPDSRTRIGVAYHSRMGIALSGRTQLAAAPVLAQIPFVRAAFAEAGGHVSGQITLPDSVDFGVTRAVTDRLSVSLQGEWTHWSLLSELNFTTDHPGGASTSFAVNWRDTWFGGIAGTYRLTPAVTLRGGFSYDQSASADAATRITQAPDSDRYTLSGGVEYTPLPRLSLELSYAHLFTPAAPIDATSAPEAGTLTGTYHDSANVVALGSHLRF
ncbi:outer membrane protein transport protein [Nguyenibacter vanlangensis]|uniref:Outer membrane protein transport protein n=1 Tax=Nguyenibacter vanlangensis TaxID=1216886 RepID=A0ABZ3D8K4_9PROT